MTEATTTPTPFTWSSGPESVQVTGSWDQWTEKVALDKQADGTFSKKVPLPSNTKVHYKFIVDGNWTISPSEATANDQGNVNNIVDVGPAPTSTQAATTKAGEIGAGVAAGVAGAAAATTAAAYKFTDHVNGNTTEGKEVAPAVEEKKTVTEAEKKADPAAAIRETADEDVRNSMPTSVTSVSHAAVPVIASAVATVTGADIMRGNPEALPVTQKEINDTQAKAMKGDNSFLASRIEPQGGSVSDPAAATTENAKAAASVANSATVGAPVVPVTHNGFAANVTAESGGLTTSGDANKEGGAKAAAVAAGSAGVVGAAGAGGVKAATAVKKEETVVKPADIKGSARTTEAPKELPTIGSAKSKASADKASAPAAASSGPLAVGKETTTPAAVSTADKTLPGTPPKKPVTRSSVSKGDTIKEKSAHPRGVSSAHTTMASEASSTPSTPDKKKRGFLGKIKQALSPATSPSSK